MPDSSNDEYGGIVAEKGFFCHNGRMGQDNKPTLEQGSVLGASMVAENPEREGKKDNLPLGLERLAKAIKYYISSPTRLSELKVAGLMVGAETIYDIRKTAHIGNEWGNEYDWFNVTEQNVGPMPREEFQKLLDPLGDVWEISVGQTIVRAALSELNRHAGKELVGDDAAFWISLLLPLLLKSAHSLGFISIFGIHDRMDNPAPLMLIGQGLAAIVLTRAHYAAKKRELNKTLGIDDTTVGGKVRNVLEAGLRRVFDEPRDRKVRAVDDLAINSVNEAEV